MVKAPQLWDSTKKSQNHSTIWSPCPVYDHNFSDPLNLMDLPIRIRLLFCKLLIQVNVHLFG
uniref:Uncharacterized protein n=1 Tax=Nelumbo nucifera TaxID=4432 RepID=A0A822YVI7_NELNU|nr:TPA_asm: hypothetical protein HUJ06_007171 [Nelumbo nucifera]